MGTSPPHTERHALLADGNATLRAFVFRVLADDGFVVHEVSDGRRMWRRTFEPPTFDLVIADLRLPVVDGLTVLEDFRSRVPRARLVVMTASPDESARRRASSIGAVLLVKPFGMDALRAAVHPPFEPATQRGWS